MKTLTLIGAILVCGAAATAVTSSAVSAQESTASTTKSDLSFSGSVMGGIRSFLTGRTDGTTGTRGQTVGPFIRPGIGLDYKNDSITVNAAYEFEATGAKGFGDKGTEIQRGFGDNAYFKHNPNVMFTGKFNDTFGTRILADLVFKTYNGPQSENVSELVLEPMLSAKINSNITLLVGYSYFRQDNLDAATGRGATGEESSSFFAEDVTDASASLADINSAIAQGIASSNLVPKVNNRHTGKLEVDAKLSETVKLNTYVWAGRRVYTQSASGGLSNDRWTYRLNADLKTKPVKDLSVALRYRFNMDRMDDLAAGSNLSRWGGYHLGRIIASYNLTKELAINLENEATFAQKSFKNSASVYENENYLGLSYNF